MKAEKEKIVRLLKTAKGQIEGIIKMVEDDKYCIDISNQIIAAEAILRKTNKEIISSHMKCCVKDSFEHDDESASNEKIDELVNIIDKLSK